MHNQVASLPFDAWRRRCAPSVSWIVCGTIVLLGFFLRGVSPTRAAARAAGTDSLSAAAVAFEFRYGPAPRLDTPPPSSRNQWIARDKAKHVVFSGLWTLSSQYVLVQKADWSEGDALPVSIASSAAVGVAKELYDASRPAGTVSGKDLVADGVGIGMAVGLILL